MSKKENEYFETAVRIAAEAHRGQVDKSGLPYILHPLAVKLADLAHNTDPSRAGGLNEKRRKKYEIAKKILMD